MLGIVKPGTNLVDSAKHQSARIRHRIMQLTAADDDIDNFLLDFFFIVITLCADLFEAGAFQMNPVHRNPQLIGIEIAAIVQLPCRCRQDILRFSHPFQAVSHFHSCSAPFLDKGDSKSVRFLSIFNDKPLAQYLQL